MSTLPDSSNSAFVAKTLLQLGDRTLPTPQVSPIIRAEVTSAMQRLVAIVAQLRSPEGGWPADLAPTTENLTPYVIEEAYEVLEALAPETASVPSERSSCLEPAAACADAWLMLEDLTTYLLWYISRSSYPFMHLLEGVPAQAFEPGQAWQPGMLRLAVILEFVAPDLHWSFDLATMRSGDPQLTPEALVQLEQPGLPTAPIWTANLLQQLIQPIALTTPEILPWFTPLSVTLLVPGQAWRSGTLQLKLDLAFTPSEVAAEANQATSAPKTESPASSESPQEQSSDAIPASPVTLEPIEPERRGEAIGQRRVRLAESLLQEQQHTFLLEQFLSHQPIPVPTPTDTETPLAALVRLAYDMADRLEDGAMQNSITPLRRESVIEQWIPQLLWWVVRSSPAAMQLTAGMEVEVLQPGATWQLGILRLVSILSIQADQTLWQVDLSTGRAIRADFTELPSQSILRFLARKPLEHFHLLSPNQEFQSVEQLTAMLSHRMRSMGRVSQLLFAGIPLELQTSEATWRSGVVQLKLGLELLPL